jgi:hypothetical protein
MVKRGAQPGAGTSLAGLNNSRCDSLIVCYGKSANGRLARPASLATDVGRSEQFFPFYSGVSMLKDGSVLGVLDFFNPVRQIVL